MPAAVVLRNREDASFRFLASVQAQRPVDTHNFDPTNTAKTARAPLYAVSC
jgi:hypothetical protein